MAGDSFRCLLTPSECFRSVLDSFRNRPMPSDAFACLPTPSDTSALDPHGDGLPWQLTLYVTEGAAESALVYAANHAVSDQV